MPMRLVTDEVEQSPIDRRNDARLPAGGHLRGVRLDFSLPARQHPVIDLRLENISEGGVCGLSAEPLNVGEQVNLFFNPHGIMPGRNRHGSVVRCDLTETGWQVAVAFERIALAA